MDSDMIKGLNKAIDAATGKTGGDYTYLNNTPVTEKLDELADAIAAGGGGASALSDLTDVDISGSVQGGKVLKYNAVEEKWAPGDDSGNVQSDWNENDPASGAYILNKPTIPDAQINSDWNESDPTSKAYITNKPTIPESATVLTKTLTAGSTSVTFTDPKLTDGSRNSIYTSNGVGPLYFDDSVDGELTLYFSATINDVGVEVVVE